MRRNHFGTEKKPTLLYRTIRYAISDVYVSFHMHLQRDLILEYSGQIYLILQRQLRSYNYLDPPTKKSKAIPAKLVPHIYKKKYPSEPSPRPTDFRCILFGMRSCEYYTTTKGENKCTRILQKGDIQFYRKCRELAHNSRILHIANKVAPTFLTQKYGFKNSTVT